METEKKKSKTFVIDTEAKKSEPKTKTFCYEDTGRKSSEPTQYVYDEKTDSYKLQHQEEEGPT